MASVRRKFDKEFKLEAVKMVRDGVSKAEVGRRLGVNDGVIHNWVRALESDGSVAFPGNGKLKPEDDELRKAQKRIRELEEEISFLKKTSSYFASLKR